MVPEDSFKLPKDVLSCLLSRSLCKADLIHQMPHLACQLHSPVISPTGTPDILTVLTCYLASHQTNPTHLCCTLVLLLDTIVLVNSLPSIHLKPVSQVINLQNTMCYQICSASTGSESAPGNTEINLITLLSISLLSVCCPHCQNI